MNEWRKVKLGEIAEVTKLAGFEFTKYIEYVDDGEIIALRALNLKDGRLDLTDIKKIKKEISEKLIRSKLYKDDILLTYTGNGYGDCAIIKEDNKYHLAPNICKITANKKILNPYFLYSFIRTKQFYCHLSNYMVGSSQPTIPMRIIRELVIPIFNINLQNKIVKILSDIDEKIELNNKINDNLEKQAQLIFKSWFIDFYPFNNKIPLNWSYTALENIADISSGRRPSIKKNTSSKDNNVPLIGASGIMGYTNKTLFNEPILIIGRVGTLGIVQRIITPCWASDNTLVIKSKYYEYIFQILKNINYENLNRGSTQPLITQNDLKNIQILLPNLNILEEFEKRISSLMKLYNKNVLENNKLSNLKNYLLPKLMNGEIDVEKVEL